MWSYADNKNNIVLDDRVVEHERIAANANFIIYNQLLKQLHLPAEKWAYDKEQKGAILVELEREVEELDAVLFKGLDFSKLASPLRLYQYNLLQLLLGEGLNYSGIGLIRERKTRFLFLKTSFQIENMQTHRFEDNELSRFIIRRAKKRDVLNAHESFFVLLNQKFNEKLLNALMLYQSETGKSISKASLVDSILNPDRLELLRQFSETQMNRL